MIVYLLIKLSRVYCVTYVRPFAEPGYYIITPCYCMAWRIALDPTQLGYLYTTLASSPSTQNPPPPPSSSVSSSPSSPTTTPGTSRVAAG